MKDFLDRFTLYARWLPALISSMPMLALWYYYTKQFDVSGLTKYVLQFKILGGVSVAFAMVYLFVHFINYISKFLEYWHFHTKDGFPSSYYMLYSHSMYPKQVKIQFRKKVKDKFGLKFPSEIVEISDKRETVKLLKHASRQISTLYIGDPQVKRANINYNFFRNLIGGSIFGIVFSIAGVFLGIYQHQPEVTSLFIVLLAIYLAIFSLQKSLLKQHGEAYAQKLLSCFLSST